MLFLKNIYWELWFRYRSNMNMPHPKEVKKMLEIIESRQNIDMRCRDFNTERLGCLRDVAVRYASISKYNRPYDILVNCSGYTVTGTAERARQIINKFRRVYKYVLWS